MKINLAVGITGSFCNHEKILKTLESFNKEKFNLIPVLSKSCITTSTRFGKSENFIKNVEKICGKCILSEINEVEPLAPNGEVDCFLIAPCTGNTLGKLANAITDGAVTMLAKAMSRNDKPIVIGVSTNDGLGLSLKNIATLLICRNYYFIPFGQDDFLKKPKSLVSDWEKTEESVEMALSGKQIQPILLRGDENV